ncbi:hypothetical protein ABT56_01355 [Photobacterium aquae]|uniref:Carboxyltransferase domain-containing protein n=1 Tax=Photobacterium aquae TaxID=1195763 RepID=A0A0J1HB56_9GAMM|nr:5-oxoprolinase subunit PxpB [Photobacterium aquae]KLV08890.1 hypothetical protein ABT56_01355 [Photobacterium aquae]
MIQLQPVSETTAIVYFGNHIDQSLIPLIRHVADSLNHPAIIERIPSYTSLLIEYRADVLTIEMIDSMIQSALACWENNGSPLLGRQIVLPVFYGGEAGPDLPMLASLCGLSEQEVIDIHCGQTYRVCAIGFAPGFAFLAPVDKRIAMPRHATPRKLVPAGSVGIAGQQTAVYPLDSPGGWQIIGNCPVSLFDPHADPVSPVEVGDEVCFEPVTKAVFLAKGGRLCRHWK